MKSSYTPPPHYQESRPTGFKKKYPTEVPDHSPPRYHVEQYDFPCYIEEHFATSVSQGPRSEEVTGCEQGRQGWQNEPTGTCNGREDDYLYPNNECTLKRAKAVAALHARARQREMNKNWARGEQERPQPRLRKRTKPGLEINGPPSIEFLAEAVPTDESLTLKLTPVTQAELLLIKDFRDFQGRQPPSFYIHMTSSQLDVDQEPGSLWEFAHHQEQLRISNVRQQTAAALGGSSHYADNEKSAYFESVKDRGRGISSTDRPRGKGCTASPIPNSHTKRVTHKSREPSIKSTSRRQGSFRSWIRIF